MNVAFFISKTGDKFSSSVVMSTSNWNDFVGFTSGWGAGDVTEYSAEYVVDGYEETPVAKWAESLPDWLKKSDPARGSGAPIGRKTSGNLPIGMDKNPFENGGNLTEQMRLYKTNRPLYDQLKAAAKN